LWSRRLVLAWKGLKNGRIEIYGKQEFHRVQKKEYGILHPLYQMRVAEIPQDIFFLQRVFQTPRPAKLLPAMGKRPTRRNDKIRYDKQPYRPLSGLLPSRQTSSTLATATELEAAV